jgi:hypothetical protein
MVDDATHARGPTFRLDLSGGRLMRAIAFIASLGLATAGVVAAFAPVVAAVPNDLLSFCPDYASTPRCAAAVGLFLAGNPRDDAIIAAVNAIIDRAHDKHLAGKACDDSEAGLQALAAATKDAGSRNLIAGFAVNLCNGTAAGGTTSELFVVHGSTGSGPAGGGGCTSGNTSGDNTSGSSGNTSGTTGNACGGNCC